MLSNKKSSYYGDIGPNGFRINQGYSPGSFLLEDNGGKGAADPKNFYPTFIDSSRSLLNENYSPIKIQ